ncbi:uncharacterized protein LOC6726218 [Drosophila simulans]|uniref:uncharacterized protein LOC6726218 n=1 Tax=Drosophila simulans TaxID=7240 RepID=UPI00078AEEBE|nr:uncharacterized protein LOC6726218 [Drosophila simulans]KMZ10282.1 uncharacterized protein Dsimw501_GD17326 [Drosophila simulans]
MERRRPRKSSRKYVRSKSNPSVGGGVAEGSPSALPATAKAILLQPDGNQAPTMMTSLLGERLKRVSRIARAPHSLQVTENPEEGGAPIVPIRESGASEVSEVNPGVMVIPEAASPRGSAVHGPHASLVFSAEARDSDSTRVSEEVVEVFRTSSARTTSNEPAGGNLRFESTPVAIDGNINFSPNAIYDQNRYSSMMSNGDYNNGNRGISERSLGACHHGWAMRQQQAAAGPAGRDTLGFAISLGAANLGQDRCSLGVACDEDCGYGTGCDFGCGQAHGVDPGSFLGSGTMGTGPLTLATGSGGPPVQSALRGAQGGGYKPVGAGQRGTFGTDFGSEQLNFFVTFLLEVLGVLVFFAICTITFWITLGYHVVQLLVDLKNADRNIQVAVAIVFGLLLVAFAISQVTNLSGSCCHSRDRARSRAKSGGIGFFHRSTKAKTKSCASKAKTCAHKSKIKKAASCGPSLGFHTHRKTRYTDCEGRAIFLSSRRYAIPTEMKQPPTIVLWMRDTLARMLQ